MAAEVPGGPAQQSIATKLLRTGFAIYLVVAVALTLIHMVSEFQHVESLVEQDLRTFQLTLERGFAKVIWDGDRAQATTMVRGIMDSPTVVGIKLETDMLGGFSRGRIRSPDGKTVLLDAKGKAGPDRPGAAPLIAHEFPVIYGEEAVPKKVGTMAIYSSRDVVFSRVKLGFTFIIVNALLKSVLLWIILFVVIERLLARPLKLLTVATSKLNLDNLNEGTVDIRTTGRTELKVLEETFNQMIVKLAAQIDLNRRVSGIFQKFVPKQFLTRIAKEGIDRIVVGKANVETVTILFCDIRGFTSISEKLTPQGLMDFLNEYLEAMNLPIHDNHGFIDKFVGDAIMALFDRRDGDRLQQSEDAVNAAIGMLRAVQAFNRLRVANDQPSIEIGIGIHTGVVIIGTVGSKDRMDSTVLGDSVNLASRIEGLTKHYGVSLLISANTLHQLPTGRFDHRQVDLVKVKGKDVAETVYEVFNTDSEEVREAKRATLPAFNQALQRYHAKDWPSALSGFTECLDRFPFDRLADMYVGRCQQHIEEPPPESSDTIFIMKDK